MRSPCYSPDMNNLIPRVPQNPCRSRRPRGARRCLALLLLSAGLSAGAADRLPAHLYPQNDAFRKEMAELRARGITLTDYHIHIRGGMTPQKAAERQ
ncbi:MAG TPA: hypothetical protein PLH01_04105, partial [Kiritimatiellia bacterium]|nr:hypothetical protein [Kiritimatiellia bacterium]